MIVCGKPQKLSASSNAHIAMLSTTQHPLVSLRRFFFLSCDTRKKALTIAPHPVGKHASSSHNTQLVGGGVAPRGWWHIVAKLLQFLQFPAWEQPLSPTWGRLQFPAWEHLPVLCLDMFAVAAWDACKFPACERLLVCMPCLGMLAVPAWDACQSRAWERLPVPCLRNVCQCLAWACLPVPAWECF